MQLNYRVTSHCSYYGNTGADLILKFHLILVGYSSLKIFIYLFTLWYWGLNPELHACEASALPELHPQPSSLKILIVNI